MDEHIFDKIHEVDMKQTMEDYYIDYAMSVIASRALPDVRDGLKQMCIRDSRYAESVCIRSILKYIHNDILVCIRVFRLIDALKLTVFL